MDKMDIALIKVRDKTIAQTIKDLNHWVISMQKHKGNSYHSLFKGRAIMNAHLLSKKIKLLSKEEIIEICSLVEQVLQDYITTTGRYVEVSDLKY